MFSHYFCLTFIVKSDVEAVVDCLVNRVDHNVSSSQSNCTKSIFEESDLDIENIRKPLDEITNKIQEKEKVTIQNLLKEICDTVASDAKVHEYCSPTSDSKYQPFVTNAKYIVPTRTFVPSEKVENLELTVKNVLFEIVEQTVDLQNCKEGDIDGISSTLSTQHLMQPPSIASARASTTERIVGTSSSVKRLMDQDIRQPNKLIKIDTIEVCKLVESEKLTDNAVMQTKGIDKTVDKISSENQVENFDKSNSTDSYCHNKHQCNVKQPPKPQHIPSEPLPGQLERHDQKQQRILLSHQKNLIYIANNIRIKTEPVDYPDVDVQVLDDDDKIADQFPLDLLTLHQQQNKKSFLSQEEISAATSLTGNLFKSLPEQYSTLSTELPSENCPISEPMVKSRESLLQYQRKIYSCDNSLSTEQLPTDAPGSTEMMTAHSDIPGSNDHMTNESEIIETSTRNNTTTKTHLPTTANFQLKQEHSLHATDIVSMDTTTMSMEDTVDNFNGTTNSTDHILASTAISNNHFSVDNSNANSVTMQGLSRCTDGIQTSLGESTKSSLIVQTEEHKCDQMEAQPRTLEENPKEDTINCIENEDQLVGARHDRYSPTSCKKTDSFVDNQFVKCNFCSLCFKSRESMKFHMLAQHNKRDVNTCFKCKKCKETFTSKKFLLRHKLLRHLRDSSGYKCNICGQTFVRTFYLKSHLKSHRNIKLSVI